MAQRIDDGVQPTAHTAVQAMIVRAQQMADQTSKRIGLVYDLTQDQISLVDMSNPVPEGVDFLRVLVPSADTEADGDASDTLPPETSSGPCEDAESAPQ